MDKSETTKSEALSILLDSSLITQYRLSNPTQLFDIKIIDCNGYLQVYKFSRQREKSDSLWTKEIKKIDTDSLVKKEKKLKDNIKLKNITRSKLQCQRLAKTNLDVWKTFITLTFEENETDIKKANQLFDYWRTNIKKIKKDFKYIAVPEFQKRGAVHYHLLTNIDITDTSLIIPQKTNSSFFDIKYWSHGFVSIQNIQGDVKKIVGYLAKYMTKDCDERLYGQRRYLNSNNLIKPIESYIDLSDERHKRFLEEKLKGMKIDYENEYSDNIGIQTIQFCEYSKFHNVYYVNQLIGTNHITLAFVLLS